MGKGKPTPCLSDGSAGRQAGGAGSQNLDHSRRTTRVGSVRHPGSDDRRSKEAKQINQQNQYSQRANDGEIEPAKPL
jgi:hypothetical protein